MEIAIFGAGGFGRETAVLIRQINQVKSTWNLVGFYDDAVTADRVDGLPVLGGLSDLVRVKTPLAIVIAIADPRIKEKIYRSIHSEFISFPTLIHPTCITGEGNTFGKGCIITAGCAFTLNIAMGDFVIVNLLTTVGHDVVIGSFSSIMPNCSISGFDKIGQSCMIGAGARILQNLSLGDGTIVGAGAVVTKSFGDGSLLVGVPAVNAK
jgi:sugar O-acyltransferase (sialic acid O-acetyltransferase NeuD family)